MMTKMTKKRFVGILREDKKRRELSPVLEYMAKSMAMPDALLDQKQNWIAGHMFTFAYQERARTRRAIAPALRHLDSVAGTLERNNWPGAADMIRDDIETIESATRAPRPARAKKGNRP